jgi:hypothetical protein
MRESSLTPTNLLTQQRSAHLMPDQKLILLATWSAPWINCAGVGELPVRPFAAALGFDPSALETGISTLVFSGLLMFDKVTGELFVLDWFRFHKFKTEMSRGILARSTEKIQSDLIKKVVIEKSMSCFPTATATATATSTKAAAAPASFLNQSAKHKFSLVIIKNEQDQILFDQLEKNNGIEKIEVTARFLIAKGKQPYLSSINKILAPAKINSGGQARPAVKKYDPIAREAGLAAAKQILRQ